MLSRIHIIQECIQWVHITCVQNKIDKREEMVCQINTGLMCENGKKDVWWWPLKEESRKEKGKRSVLSLLEKNTDKTVWKSV